MAKGTKVNPRNRFDPSFGITPEAYRLTYLVWRDLQSRCHNPKNMEYHNYGGRGVTVCPQWCGPDGFRTFLKDMGPRPVVSPAGKSRMSIDRRDNSKGYSPQNCHWATPAEQARNTRRNVYYTLGNETYHVAEWARRFGCLCYSTLYKQLKRGYTILELAVHYGYLFFITREQQQELANSPRPPLRHRGGTH
jgi:hypothetical protein